jgi:hypothetical protein
MCDDNNDATPAFDGPDSVRQRLVARIQIGIGFVADEEKWIAVQNSSENITMIAENAGYDLNLRAEDQHKWYLALEAGFRAEDLNPLSASREKRLTEPTWDRQV